MYIDKKYCDNSTRKIHISSNFILSISLLIMFDTLLLRPSLHCDTPLHFATLRYTSLHFTTLHHNSPNYTSLHLLTLHYPLIQLYPFTFPIVLFHFTSHHYTRHSTVLIPKIISKKSNSFTALKNFSSFHFTPLFILFYFSLLFYFILLFYLFYLFTCKSLKHLWLHL